MGDDDYKRSNRKPVSLNDSHYRLLQELSAPPKKLHPSSATDFCEEEEGKSVKVEGRRRLLKASNMATFLDDDIDHHDNLPKITDQDKPKKVKIKGRRRLCKLSSRDDENDEDRVLEDDVPSFAGIADFDSPLAPKPVGDGQRNSGVSEIRGILNDLSSRLDFLSIEKKKVHEDVDKQAGNKEKKIDLSDFASADSSFSHASEPSDASLAANKNVDCYLESAADEQEEEFDCCGESEMIVGGNKQHKVEQGRTCTSVASVEESSVHNVEEKESNDRCNDSEDDDFVTSAYGTKKAKQNLMQNEHKFTKERLRYAGRSFIHHLRDQEEDDDDDCVVLNAKSSIVEKRTCGDMLKGSSGFSKVDNGSIDLTNDFVAEDDGLFTMSGPHSTYKLPGKIAKILYPHQVEGLKWLWSLHCQGKGGILGDDMGLGKTMQICGYLAGLFHSRLTKRVMIVAPKTLLPHWIKELSAVGLSRKIREYFGTSAKARQYELQYVLQDKGILLTTYDIVRNNSKSLKGDGYFADEESEDGFAWDYMILDEGHIIKNPSTQRAKSLLEIPSAHRIIISGTPLQNNLKELWALFNFSCPGLLGDNKGFKDKYERKILRGNEKNASQREKLIGSTVAKELREHIQPFFLRRLKSEVFKEDDTSTVKLSKKNEIIVWLRLTTCQRRFYEAFLQSEIVLSAFDGSPLAALTILKKICDHPLLLTKRAAEDVLEELDSMLTPDDAGVAEKLAMHVADVAERSDFQENHDNLSCKISFILSLLGNLIPEGHNVLIFSQTRKMLNLIQESLISNGYKFLRIDGTTKAADRVKIVLDFQEGGGASIFLLTSQVGGLGLTLTNADRVIVVDPAWNPSTDNQSVDRAYRIGQMKDVIVYRLMTCGTVEEKIYRKQIFKGGLFKSATEHKEQIRYFSQQDLRELFSLPKQGFDVSLTQQQLHEEHDSQHKMDEFLEGHIKFLETQGIAGVSHHSLLFSKTAPVEVIQEEEEEEKRRMQVPYVRNSSSSNSLDYNVEGAAHAFNPKDVKLNMTSSSPNSSGKLTESEIKARVDRLSQILGNVVTVSRLPDQGARLRKQISELNLELQKLRKEKNAEKEIISLDELAEELGAMNV